MALSRRIVIQLVVFAVISLSAGAVMTFRYIDAPALLFGVGHYSVSVDLQRAAGLYPDANVTYRGTQVGRVTSVDLTPTGVRARLRLDSGIPIPSQLRAEVHSQSAIGEQFIDLRPQVDDAPPLADGDVIPVGDTAVPPDIDSLIDAANRGLAAIPQDNLKTAIDESFIAVGGLGPDLARLVKGSTQLAIDSEHNLAAMTTLIDESKPILDSQSGTADAISDWAAHLASITGQLRASDVSVAGLLVNGGPAVDQAQQLIQRVQPTLPVLLANLASIGDVALTYQPALEQLLVLLPQGVANMQGTLVGNLNTKQDYKGMYLDFKLNLNLPPVCNTGFLPPQQQRAPAMEDYPDRPPGDLYCRVPQDSPFNVRGARNYPCMTVPGKRAPTVKMCESSEEYVPLNDGFNWKGDPNATLSGQGVPQLPPGAPEPVAPPAEPPSPPPPIAVAAYDPATGAYLGPDGKLYRQSDLSTAAPKERTWQSMLTPAPGN
jgi:phospholipid/cholesterol/gamma-HCH transport system substrate-binding protein